MVKVTKINEFVPPPDESGEAPPILYFFEGDDSGEIIDGIPTVFEEMPDPIYCRFTEEHDCHPDKCGGGPLVIWEEELDPWLKAWLGMPSEEE